jgi:RimJ/RimL family protein N-acetyltransferase
MINIKETEIIDLENVMKLWNDGEVMFYVGFPNGLNINTEGINKWYQQLKNNPDMKHYSIYDTELGYLGETFYYYDIKHDLASLDIKLFPFAQGKGVGTYALTFAINQLFINTKASRCYVDPHLDNSKAFKLYRKLGFMEASRPSFLEEWPTYLELTRENWLKKQ